VFGLIFVFWTAYFVHAQLSACIARARAGAQIPFVLNGLELKLDRFVRPALFPNANSRWYLLLFVSDRCPHSHDELATWKRLLRETPFTRDDMVIIISSHGGAIGKSLEDVAIERHVPHVVAVITDVLAFGIETGLVGTPTTAILDRRFRLRLVAERVTPTVADEIIRVFFRQSGNTTQEAPYERKRVPS
jgi:hypothetical protein